MVWLSFLLFVFPLSHLESASANLLCRLLVRVRLAVIRAVCWLNCVQLLSYNLARDLHCLTFQLCLSCQLLNSLSGPHLCSMCFVGYAVCIHLPFYIRVRQWNIIGEERKKNNILSKM